MASTVNPLPQVLHQQILWEQIIPKSGLDSRTSYGSPQAVILAGQPGAGKGGLAGKVRPE